MISNTYFCPICSSKLIHIPGDCFKCQNQITLINSPQPISECKLSTINFEIYYRLIFIKNNLVIDVDSSMLEDITSFISYSSLEKGYRSCKSLFETDFIPFDQIKSYISNIDSLLIFQ